MSILVDGQAIPVVWRPSDISGPDSDGHPGRFKFGKSGTTQVIRAIVHHRVVGTLESMTNSTFKPTLDDILQAGERRVSSHFGIGFWDTQLQIVQYVALENTAYCNGQSDRDRTACTWRLWIDAGRPDANGMTVSIEHEDNGATDGGDGTFVVRPEIIAASIALDRLLLSGDGPAIRAAGIRCSDAAAAQLGRIEPSTQTLVDHKVVSPITKPFCWRAVGDDAGFPQARYVAALSTQEDEDMSIYTRTAQKGRMTVKAGTTPSGYKPTASGWAVVKTWSARAFDSTAPFVASLARISGTSTPSSLLEVPPDGGFFAGLWVSTAEVSDETLDPVPEPPAPDCTAEIAAAITADRASARITYPEETP